MYKEYLKFFQTKFPEVCLKMKNTTHHFSNEKLNPYHLEGDVFTHTMMVYHQAKEITDDNDVLIAALLHDLGKERTYSRNEEKERVYFKNHENIGALLSIDILEEFEKEFPNTFNKLNVIKLIAFHSDLYYIGSFDDDKNYNLTQKEINELNKKFGKQKDLYQKLLLLGYADNLGRFSEIDNTRLENSRAKYFDNFIPTEIFYEKKDKEAIILVGLPASGKSTYIKNLNGYEILSTDNLITEKYPNLSYEQAFNKIIEKDEFNLIENKMFDLLKKHIKDGKNLIIDRTNLTKKTRRKFLNIIPDKYYNKKGVVFLTSLEQNKQFNLERNGKVIGSGTMEKMLNNFFLPNFDEFNEIEYRIQHKLKSKKDNILKK